MPAPKTIAERFQRILDRIEGRLASVQKDKAKFLADFEKDCHHALSWSESLFEAVAMEAVLLRLKTYLVYFRDMSDDDFLAALDVGPATTRLDMLDKWVQKDAIMKARQLSHGTMQTANLLEYHEAKFTARVAEGLEHGFAW